MSFSTRLSSDTSKLGKLIRGLVIGLPVYLLYLSGLTENPPGFFVDESALSYTAWTLYLTGQSEFGQPWPLYFPIFPLTPPFYFLGYADPMQIYVLAALFYIFPPSFF